jgi:hypothetical protein
MAKIYEALATDLTKAGSLPVFWVMALGINKVYTKRKSKATSASVYR